MDESSLNESGLFFEPDMKKHNFEDLASLHPPFELLPKLKEIYTDRVDPLMKLLHLPTFWVALASALQQPQAISKSFEAAIFAFYLAAISAMREDECQTMFATQKSIIFSRYRVATRQALVNADFLSTSNPMTLRAYAIFMVSHAP